jgi:DNA-directed RNA polymerase subunit RPC12/RpoP
MIATEFANPADELAVQRDTENFVWFVCSNCGQVFMAEATTKKGYCPYCQYEMMLETESKRIPAKGSDESEFVWFFSPKCGNFFLADDTHQMGVCPYCGEPIDLTAPVSTDLEESPPPLVAWVRAHADVLFALAVGIFVVSITGFYLLRERQVMLSLNPIDAAAATDTTPTQEKRTNAFRRGRRRYRPHKSRLEGAAAHFILCARRRKNALLSSSDIESRHTGQ